MELAQSNIDTCKPIQYIVGGTEFCGLWFDVSTDTLIPRPETKVLIEYITDKYKGKKVRIIDLGTGCGNIAITLAKNMDANIIALDISLDAIKIARKNAKRHKIEDKIKFFCNNWFSALKVKEEPFDLIVGNPPYIAEEEWISISPTVRDYEPRVALLGGEKGLWHYKTILKEAHNFLIYNGEMVLEIGWNQGSLVKILAENNRNYTDVKIIKDSENRDRVISVIKN